MKMMKYFMKGLQIVLSNSDSLWTKFSIKILDVADDFYTLLYANNRFMSKVDTEKCVCFH